jgi:pimeloyl-ACP methyl ester carboxylesterase
LPEFLSLPDADEVFTVATDDGAVLPVYRIAGPKDGPALLFGHANGLAAGSYAPWLRLLARRCRVFAWDARGHGGSHWPAGPLDKVFSVDRMAEDLAAVSAAVAARAGVPAYAGHSLGGAAGLRLAAAGKAPDWPHLLIFEPPIFPPPTSHFYEGANARQEILIAGTLKRRSDWPSPEAFCERLKGRGMFGRFDPATLAAHCRATLKPKPEGGFTLCCPPEVEAMLFRGHQKAADWTALASISRPLDLIGGDPTTPDNDWISPAVPDMAACMPKARVTQMVGTGHMLICEAPEACAELVLARVETRP